MAGSCEPATWLLKSPVQRSKVSNPHKDKGFGLARYIHYIIVSVYVGNGTCSNAEDSAVQLQNKQKLSSFPVDGILLLNNRHLIVHSKKEPNWL